MKKILIIGLPWSGKTTFAKALLDKLGEHKISSAWYNGDHVRHMYDDWDFSLDGRLRQAQRMTEKANACKDIKIVSVCDFVCPTEYFREIFQPDILVWMDTIEKSEYEDTNQLFEKPTKYDYCITQFYQNAFVIDDIIRNLK
jgi:adenylylsulfate kinase